MLSKINFPDSNTSRTKIMSEIKDLNKKKISELVALAIELGIDSSGKKDELIQKIEKNLLKIILLKKNQEKKVTTRTIVTDTKSLTLNLMELLSLRVYWI